MSVEAFFRGGRTMSEIRRSNRWRSNPRLAKTIERLPSAIAYIRKDSSLPYKDGKRKYYRTTYRDLYAV